MKKSFSKTLAILAACTLLTGAACAETLRIGISDDPTNLGRGLKLLQSAGFLEVSAESGYAPEIKDITEYHYDIELIPAQANMLPATIDDLDGIVIGGSYGIPAGLLPSRDGLAVESGGDRDNPFVCVIAARSAEKDNPDYAKIVSAYRTQLVAQYMMLEWKEARYPAFPFDAKFDVSADFLDSINGYESSKSGRRVVRVGVCGAMNGQWNAVQKILDERGDNIYIELVEFDSFNLPNEALDIGDIELNAFQHKAYLAREISRQGYKIESIGDTYLGPQGLYSHRFKTLDELKAAAKK